MVRASERARSHQSGVVRKCSRYGMYFSDFRASSKVKSGNMVGSLWASIDLPLPGVPIIIILCPPAAATSKARFTFCWPLRPQNQRDMYLCAEQGIGIHIMLVYFFRFAKVFYYVIQCIRTVYLNVLTTAASSAFSRGSITLYRAAWRT